MDTPESYREIKGVIDRVRIIDSHEHIEPELLRINRDVDAFATLFSGYVSSDLVSAGMSSEDLGYVRNPVIPLKQRWKKLGPYWESVQNTGYVRALNRAVKDLYGVDGIRENTYLKLSERMKKANKKGLYRWILKEKCRIDTSLDDYEAPRDSITGLDRQFFVPVARFQDFLFVREKNQLISLAKTSGMGIHTLDDFVEAFELVYEKLAPSLVGVKIGLAYRRTLEFDKVVSADAERVFNRIYNQRAFKKVELEGSLVHTMEGISWEEAKPLQDYMVHKLIQLAIRFKLPIQIHTGFHEGNENVISNSNVVHLLNLFFEYKEAKFDIFHGSYPYMGELAVLAKTFPNVYVDMAWLHVLSPSVARRALSEWLDVVPANKIIGFGGDYRFVEGVYGHLQLAKENIARTLAEKVENDGYTVKEAVNIARGLLRNNALELFFPKGLQGTRGE